MRSTFPDAETQTDYSQALERLFKVAHELNDPKDSRHVIKQVDEARQALFIISATAPLLQTVP